MAIIIVSDNLNILNNTINIQFYNTLSLSYTQISSVTGAQSYEISGDQLTLFISPSGQVGSVEVTVTTFSFGTIAVPVYFVTPYERSTVNISDAKDLYPENMWLWDLSNPKYLETQSITTMCEGIIDPIINDPNKLIPNSQYKNYTFPEYCSNNFIAIAICLATEQYFRLRNNPDFDTLFEYCVVFGTNPIDASFIDPASCIKTCTPDTSFPLVDGKYLNFTSSDGYYYASRYGCDNPGSGYIYCDRYKSIKIAAIYSGSERFIFQNWQNIQGVPAVFDILYQRATYVPSEPMNSFVIPSAARVPFNTYDPVSWVNNVSHFVNVIFIKFDGRDFHISVPGNPDVFTWDVSDWGKLIDIGTWGA